MSGGLFNVRFVHFRYIILLRNRYEGSPTYAAPNIRQNLRPNLRQNLRQNVSTKCRLRFCMEKPEVF